MWTGHGDVLVGILVRSDLEKIGEYADLSQPIMGRDRLCTRVWGFRGQLSVRQ